MPACPHCGEDIMSEEGKNFVQAGLKPGEPVRIYCVHCGKRSRLEYGYLRELTEEEEAAEQESPDIQAQLLACRALAGMIRYAAWQRDALQEFDTAIDEIAKRGARR